MFYFGRVLPENVSKCKFGNWNPTKSDKVGFSVNLRCEHPLVVRSDVLNCLRLIGILMEQPKITKISRSFGRFWYKYKTVWEISAPPLSLLPTFDWSLFHFDFWDWQSPRLISTHQVPHNWRTKPFPLAPGAGARQTKSFIGLWNSNHNPFESQIIKIKKRVALKT